MKNIGQYFTPKHVADFMVGLASCKKTGSIIEPSCGEGVFLESLQDAGFSDVVGYEIDTSIKPKTDARIIWKSFVGENDIKPVDLIIGNPPYVRWKNLDKGLQVELKESPLWNEYFSAQSDYLCIFILKSVSLLKQGGELIFITPEYWFNTKGAQSLRNYLCANGYITDVIHFCETPIFDKVSSSIVIFRFVKDTSRSDAKPRVNVLKYTSKRKLSEADLRDISARKKSEHIEFFESKQFSANTIWTIASDDVLDRLAKYENQCARPDSKDLLGSLPGYSTIGDIADIANGMVSGLDEAFQIPDEVGLNAKESQRFIQVLKAKNISQYSHGPTHRYVFIEEGEVVESEFSKIYPNFKKVLSPFRDDLNKRYLYGREIQYWEWVFPRSLKLFRKNQHKIFVPCKERISNKDYFRFSVVEPGIFPTQDVTALVLKNGVKESLYYVLAILNSKHVFEWLRHKGVVKGNIVEFSEKPIASIPFRKIDWRKSDEVALHNKIAKLAEEISSGRTEDCEAKLAAAIDALLDMP